MSRFRIVALYIFLILLGGLLAFQVAPDVDSALSVSTDVRLIPYDPKRPDVLVDQQLDRVCFRLHFHKVRDVVTWRRAVTIIAPDGTRHFSEEIDGRTGYSFSHQDSRAKGFIGDTPLCVIIPDNFDPSQGYAIEIFTQYEPMHHLWLIEQTLPLIHVGPLGGVP